MPDPQQPEARRSGRGGATPQESGETKAREAPRDALKGRPHGSDKGRRGGGEGGDVPPGQRPDHP
ncbi:hypothetical protein [Streptomyces sp. CC208A]|uniref:hypothetical protein n=1 Tax=Streptomyces sp. CC208A TaxID=3044573 RepID=UPI0024A9EF24|nr:hypothetical protein [Streptomyces sp. CC208A]